MWSQVPKTILLLLLFSWIVALFFPRARFSHLPSCSSPACPNALLAAIVPALTRRESWEMTRRIQEQPPVVGCAAMEASSREGA
jgi:hypothetical protein